MHHVFVSYSRVDTDWVNALTEALERARVPVWIDQRDIPVTLPWLEEVRDAIDESDLFLVCDSAAWRRSPQCAAEATFAHEAGKQECLVRIGSSTSVASSRIRDFLSGLDPAYTMRTELRVLARDWDRGLRSRGGLVSARHRRLLRRGVAVPPQLSVVERAFLRASRRRAIRRAAVAAAVFTVIGIASIVILLSNAANDRIEKINDDQARAYVAVHERAIRAGQDHYAALSDAATLGANESDSNAFGVMDGLRTPVPDDGFTVPTDAVRFAGPVGAAAVVSDGNGRFWARSATAKGVRRAMATGAPPAARATSHNLTARLVHNRGYVDVLRSGRLWRRVWVSRRPRSAAISPNGRELAVSVGSSVLLADLRLGVIRVDLRSTQNAVRDVAWSVNGGRVWALSDKLVVSWSVRDGRRLIDEPKKAFDSIFPSAHSSRVWIAADDGELREINTQTAGTTRVLRLDDTIKSASGAPDGSVAAVSGNRGLWLVPLSGASQPRRVSIADCTLGRPSVADTQTVYIPCIHGPLVRIAVSTARVTSRRMLQPGGIFAVKVLPRTHRLLATDEYGWLYEVTPAGLREIVKFTCGGLMTRLAVSPDERIVVPGGTGVGQVSCGLRGIANGSGGWTFDHVAEVENTPTLADGVAISRNGGVFAYGFSNGIVSLHPTRNILPIRLVQDISGLIRDMYVTAANDLIVATDAGIVERIPLCETCISNRVLANVAQVRLRRGLEIGTARERPRHGVRR